MTSPDAGGAESDSRDQFPTILLVEDNPGDARLIREGFSDAVADGLRAVTTGEEALDFLHQRGEYVDAPTPEFVLLDWHLPEMGGSEMLDRLSGDPDLRHIPVVVLTGSQSERDIRESYSRNANACITKEVTPSELEETLRAFEEFWLSAARLPRATEE